jgi:hypothetical protein
LLLTLPQAPVFLGQPAHGIQQTIELLAQRGEFLPNRIRLKVVRRGHARNYSRPLAEISGTDGIE